MDDWQWAMHLGSFTESNFGIHICVICVIKSGMKYNIVLVLSIMELTKLWGKISLY